MKLPRDVDGRKLAKLLSRYGYQLTRQTGSHLRLTCSRQGRTHHLTVPAHREMRVGTLSQVLKEAASYLEKDFAALLEELFGG